MHVQRYHAELAELEFEIAAFDVDIMPANAFNNFFGFYLAVDRYTAVAFFYRVMVMTVVVIGLELLMR